MGYAESAMAELHGDRIIDRTPPTVAAAYAEATAEVKQSRLEMAVFSRLNLLRCESPQGFNHTLDSWKPAEWTNAMCGELGEAANLTKKIDRHEQGIRGNIKAEDQDPDALRQRAIDEIADVIIYADLAIQRLGGNTAFAVRDKFNRKSKEIGCDILV